MQSNKCLYNIDLLQRIMQEAENLQQQQVKSASSLRKDIDQCAPKHVKQKLQGTNPWQVAPCISFRRGDETAKYLPKTATVCRLSAPSRSLYSLLTEYSRVPQKLTVA